MKPFLVMLCCLTTLSLPIVCLGQEPPPPQDFAVKKMEEAGLSHEFIELAKKSHVPEERDKIVELNVLGFLGKADYSGHFSKKAIQECRKFIKRHSSTLRAAEKRYGVPAEVIAALIWVETKFGKVMGTHPVTHVYFSLIQADHPNVLSQTLSALPGRMPATESPSEEVIEKAKRRSVEKARWALGELKSLESIYQLKAKSLETLKGSYAGAFGIPQFIPSSYLSWARPKSKKKSPNLFREEDAVFSVAFYLKANGWKPASEDTHREALFHYNRSTGYVEVILKLANELKKRS